MRRNSDALREESDMPVTRYAAVLAGLLLVGCGSGTPLATSQPTVPPTPTPASTATPAPSPSPPPTASPLPTATPAPTAVPTMTPVPVVAGAIAFARAVAGSADIYVISTDGTGLTRLADGPDPCLEHPLGLRTVAGSPITRVESPGPGTPCG